MVRIRDKAAAGGKRRFGNYVKAVLSGRSPGVSSGGHTALNPAQHLLKNAPNHNAITLCANSNGKPWTVCGFRASWRKIRRKLEAERRVNSGLTLYGLRHTVAVILRECGYDERTIADPLGQKSIETARLYARGADLTKKREPPYVKDDIGKPADGTRGGGVGEEEPRDSPCPGASAISTRSCPRR